ncbi:TIGR02444 family protein [Catenovulum sediminis]|uniref:TIGR02444 family protein n=1 Tax=Catenovulum sediminis TaxID=1740262 RepID=A0ABV1RBR6_9ALTE|nr:TIGR02444 family protein [Catenovulum sediminis]
MQQLNEHLVWQMCGALYAHNIVQTNCLLWQNQSQLNVNIILIFALLESQQYTFQPAHLDQVIIAVEDFNQAHTQLIRQARFSWRAHADKNNSYIVIKEKLLSAELEFEKQEQKIIIEVLYSGRHTFLNRPLKQSPLSYYFATKSITADYHWLLELAATQWGKVSG